MTQTRWRITTALLLSALVVGVSRGEDPAPEKAPTKDCPLSKILYINRLFKNVGYGRETQSLMILVTARIIINEEEERIFLGEQAPIPR